MNISQKTKQNIRIGILFGLIAAILFSMADFDAACDDLRSNVLRLHIIANSDSEHDQQLKLKVRDAILQESLDCFKDCDGLDDALITANLNCEKLEKIANDVIRKSGESYCARVSIGNADFDTRVYDDFTLPAGNYKSVIVNLGEAKGKNWWCVVFPCVCVPAATNVKLSDSVNKKGAYVAENAPKYEMKFKIVELYERLKKKF